MLKSKNYILDLSKFMLFFKSNISSLAIEVETIIIVINDTINISIWSSPFYIVLLI